jgi:hypothetical protein
MQRTLPCLAWLLVGLLPASAFGSVILSENFDELTPGASATAVGQFVAISGTNVDIVGSVNGSYFPTLCVAPESGNCIDMDGSNGNPQGVLQSAAMIPAGTYYLSFQLIGSQRGVTTSTTVTFGPYNQTFVLATGDTSSGIVSNVAVTLTSPSYLTFTSNTSGNIGALLDNVLITTTPASTPSPTPAPPTLLLIVAGGLALAGYAWWSRRRVA